MFCVGATRAGTSWLYRYLHEHPDCHMRSVKELHYFDSRDETARYQQVVAFERRLSNFRAKLATENRAWARANLSRRVDDMTELLEVLQAKTGGDQLYLEYLHRGREQQVIVGDLTPAYALLPEEGLAKMLALAPDAKFIYMMRDPVERMWSHVRMQAHRNLTPDVTIELKSKRIMNRTLRKGMETHIPERGDYRAAISKLRAVIPQDQLWIGFAEALFAEDGHKAIADFLGIAPLEGYASPAVHSSPSVLLSDAQRAEAGAFLADQYDYVEENIGPLPQAWRDNRVRI